MNDRSALDAINEVFDKYCDGELRDVAALGRIGRVLGLNINHHAEAKKGAGMTNRFAVRKNSGDPQYPWALIDSECPGSDRHDFGQDRDQHPCNGNCDAFMSLESAIDSIGRVGF